MNQLYNLAQQDRYDDFINHFKTLKKPPVPEIINQLSKLKVNYSYVDYMIRSRSKSKDIKSMCKYVAGYCNMDTVKYLQDHGIDIIDHIDIEDLLYNKNFEVINHFVMTTKLSSSFRASHLHQLLRTNNLILLDYALTRFGSDVRSPAHTNLLYYSIFYKLSPDVIELLLKHGVDMYGPCYMPTMVMNSYKNNPTEGDAIITLLCKYGYNYNYAPDNGFDADPWTPQECFQNTISWPTDLPMRALLHHGYIMNDDDIEMIRKKQPYRIRYLIEHYYIIETPRKSKCIDFLRACVVGDLDMIKEMVKTKRR